MKLNFKDEKYKKIAMESVGYSKSKSNHKISEAFLLILRGTGKPREDGLDDKVELKNLSNLCLKVQTDFRNKGKELSIEDCYNIIQGNFEDTPLKTEEKVEKYTRKELRRIFISFSI